MVIWYVSLVTFQSLCCPVVAPFFQVPSHVWHDMKMYQLYTCVDHRVASEFVRKQFFDVYQTYILPSPPTRPPPWMVALPPHPTPFNVYGVH